MRKFLLSLTGFILKCIVFYAITWLAFLKFNQNASFLDQHILVWVFLYLPFAIGVEEIIAGIANYIIKTLN
jgi:hypothetical protein